MVYFITESPDPIISGIIYFLADLNHAVNAILYCVVGSKFRREVLDVLCCRKMKTGKSISSMSTSLSGTSRFSSQTNVDNNTYLSEQVTA